MDIQSTNSFLTDYLQSIEVVKISVIIPVAARNKGIEIASGKYLSFLDADDYWHPHFLEETVGFMERHPIIIAVSAGQIHKIPGKKDVVMPRFWKKIPTDSSLRSFWKIFTGFGQSTITYVPEVY